MIGAFVVVGALIAAAAWAGGYYQGWQRGFVYGEGEERRRTERRAALGRRRDP